MNVSRRVLALTLVAVASSLSISAYAAEGATKANSPKVSVYGKQKVVYHMNDAQRAGAALHNIENHINAVGAGNADIVVVAHGKGIDFLLDGWKDKNGKTYDSIVQDLANKGVRFDVCNNTLKARKIDPKTVNMNATVVPSGVATLADLESKGYVYIKP